MVDAAAARSPLPDHSSVISVRRTARTLRKTSLATHQVSPLSDQLTLKHTFFTFPYFNTNVVLFLLLCFDHGCTDTQIGSPLWQPTFVFCTNNTVILPYNSWRLINLSTVGCAQLLHELSVILTRIGPKKINEKDYAYNTYWLANCNNKL